MGWSKWLLLEVWGDRSGVQISARSNLKFFKNFATVTGPIFGLLGRLKWASLAGRFGLINGLKRAGFVNGSGLKKYAQPVAATVTGLGRTGILMGRIYPDCYSPGSATGRACEPGPNLQHYLSSFATKRCNQKHTFYKFKNLL